VQARALWQALDGQGQAVMALEQQFKSLEANRVQDAGQMATKEELRLMATKEDLHKVHTDIALVRKDMEVMRKDLIIKIGSMFGVSVGLIIAAIGMAVRYLA